MLPPAPSIRRVLDLGCGTGRFTEMLGDSYHATVVGIDPSLRMLAQRAPPADGTPHFIAAHAEGLPLGAGSVDLVFPRGLLLRRSVQRLDPSIRSGIRGGHGLRLRLLRSRRPARRRGRRALRSFSRGGSRPRDPLRGHLREGGRARASPSERPSAVPNLPCRRHLSRAVEIRVDTKNALL